MKISYNLGLFLLFAGLSEMQLPAQTQCNPPDCPCLIRLADGFARQNDYVNAIRQYNAAIQCDPTKKQALNTRIGALFLQIDSLRVTAEIQREKTRETERQMAAVARRAAQNAAEMEVQRHDAERQKVDADSLKRVAEAALDLAVQRQDSANAEAQRTQLALDRLQLVFGDLTDIFVRQADEFIRTLEYDSAHDRAREAAALQVADRRQAVRRVQFELAYLFNETGETALLEPLLDSLLRWDDTTPPTNEDGISRPGNSASVRMFLRHVDEIAYETLKHRYYPHMIPIFGGMFRMGENVKQGQDVTLDDFEIAQTETTWRQYSLYCRATKMPLPTAPPWGRQGDNPVVNVSWEDAQSYIKWLNIQKTGDYRLPTEAEWEYAARGGQSGFKDNYVYAGSDDLDEVGWYGNNSEGKTHPVAGKKPNQLGLYDMSGNVWEWCADWYGEYPKTSQSNPTGPATGDARVLRGGSWYYSPGGWRASYRYNGDPDGRVGVAGFRVVRH